MIFLLIFVVLIIIFLSINIKIEIENLKISLPKKNNYIINKESKIMLKVYILKKIKITQVDLKKINPNEEKFKTRLEKIRNRTFFQKIKKDISINIIEIIRNIKINIEKMNLRVEIGTEDAAITAIGVGLISTFLAIILKNKIKNSKLQKFQVMPIYQNKNTLKIQIEGIFDIKIVNIIDIIKFLIKGRVEKNDRTSYRRSYAYSNE